MSGDDFQPPQPELIDTAHAIARATVSAVPVIGGPAAELFDVIVPASLDRRRQAWFELVSERLRRLEERGIPLADLAADEGFITIVVEASKAAFSTHIEAKVSMLADCIESAALPEDRDDFMAMRLLQYVEELTPEHFIVLTYLADPAGWFDRKGLAKPDIYMGPPRHLLDNAKVGVAGDVLEVVLRDLSDRGLANTGSLGTMMSEHGVWQALATPRGRLLLDFVQLM